MRDGHLHLDDDESLRLLELLTIFLMSNGGPRPIAYFPYRKGRAIDVILSVDGMNARKGNWNPLRVVQESFHKNMGTRSDNHECLVFADKFGGIWHMKFSDWNVYICREIKPETNPRYW